MTDHQVSLMTGRRQGPALRIVTIVAWLLAGLGTVGDMPWSHISGLIAVSLIVATPLLRIAWLIYRLRQEKDWRFVGIAVGLLLAIAVGSLIVILTR